MTPTKKKTDLRFLVAILILLAGGWAVEWQYGNMSAARADSRAKELDTAHLQEQLDQLNGFSKEYEALPEQVNKLRHIIPVGTEVAEVLVQFQSIATQSGLVWNSIGFEESPKNTAGKDVQALPSGVVAMPITVKVSGPYANFRQYIGLIEDNLRLVDVNSITIQNGDYLLEVTVYYMEE